MMAEEPDPMLTAYTPSAAGEPTMASRCVARVQEVIVPDPSDVVTIAYANARTAVRPDGLQVVEVPYTINSKGNAVDGSYVCGVAATGDFAFFSDHERLTREQWDGYATARRPGNLQAGG